MFKARNILKSLLLLIAFQVSDLYGQSAKSSEKKVTGLDFGVLPSFVYNTDKGLQYGLLANFYYYGKKTIYPDYLFNLYLQSSRTTKKGYVNYLFFDSGRMLPDGMRLIIDASFVKRGYQHFYGFNGYNSVYNKAYTDPSSPQFISRHYYYFEEKAKTILVDLRGKFVFPHFYWGFGLGYYQMFTSPFKNRLPNTPKRPTLFEKYVNQGVIPSGQNRGGSTFFLKSGLIFDTRDNEKIPTKGLWIEGVCLYAPSFLANKSPYSQVSLIFHQYLSLSPKLVFAYRLAYQTKTSGQIPFYMLPELQSTYRSEEALGGSKTIRGILSRRLIGNGFALGNFEFRYIPFRMILLKRNLGIGFNLFEDMGIITDPYKINGNLTPNAFDYKAGKEKIHTAVGAGVRFIVNHNFIVALDYGHTLDKRDGLKSLDIGLDYLF